MPKPKDKIQSMIEDADEGAERILAEKNAPNAPSDWAQPDNIAPGMVRLHLVSEKHHDGKAKKTWLRDSVFEIDEYTARKMVDVLKCAFPTTEPINEILVAYEGN